MLKQRRIKEKVEKKKKNSKMWKLNMAAQSVRCFAPTTASTSTKMKVVLTKKIPQRALLRLTENKE